MGKRRLGPARKRSLQPIAKAFVRPIAKAFRQPPRNRSGAGHRDLLSKHRPDRRLGRIDGAGHPQPASTSHQRADEGIVAQRRQDRLGIGVQVEQPPAPANRVLEVAPVLEPEAGFDAVIPGFEPDQAGAVLQAHRPPVDGAVPALDTGYRPRSQECRRRRAIERFAGGQPEALALELHDPEDVTGRPAPLPACSNL